jgi:hypothetical protein
MVEIIKATLNELVVRFDAVRWRRDHEAAAEHVDWLFRIRTNLALFAVPAIPSLMVARARADDDWGAAVAVERVYKRAFVVCVYVEDRQPAALTRAKSGLCRDARGVALPANRPVARP